MSDRDRAPRRPFLGRRALLAATIAMGWLAAAAGPTRAETALGDWGHFLSYRPKIHLNNPDGRAFTATVHVMRWPVERFNRPARKFRLVGPGGEVVGAGEFPTAKAEFSLDAPAGPRGVYTLEPVDDGGNVWVSSTLEQSVVWTGDPEAHAVEGRRAVFQASVPRRWWFWVPADTSRFKCKAQRADRYMSQREDWGFFIVTPRGQRIAALWGQPPKTPRNDYRRDQEVTVEVEPGAGGRFWALEVRLGDSHNYSNINFTLDGVPPYLARSPEEWFDPDSGRRPEVGPYDETPFIQSARDEAVMKKRWPDTYHFSPCPSLGDPDGVEILGPGRFALWNPAGRELKLRVGTYLPRSGFEGDPAKARLRVSRREGKGEKVLLEKHVPIKHVHGDHGHPAEVLRTGRGVSLVDVSGVERWFAFTYPATPMVLVGEANEGDAAAGDGWNRFRFSVGTARNWYFFVPEGTRRFNLRAAAGHETDVVKLAVCSPDRTVELIYGNAGERTVDVPEGLDGKIWFLRPDVGSATRFPPGDPDRPRYLDIDLTVELRGVPGYLAPTWEQWFDPDRPAAPARRCE